jgi:branched-chain amino acid aminotransferase
MIEESGTMNIAFVINDTLVTPKISETILSGITRDSILTLAKDRGLSVEEKVITVSDLIQAHRDGTLKEVFGIGTAATMIRVKSFTHRSVKYEMSVGPGISDDLGNDLDSIKRGKSPDKHNWISTLVHKNTSH